MRRSSRNPPTTLHDAAYVGNLSMVAHVLNEGTSIDALDEDGCTALWLAVRHKQGHVLRLLRGLEADPNRPGPDGRTALHLVIADADADHLDTLLDSRVGPRVNVNAADQDGNTPLHAVALALTSKQCPEAYRMDRLDTWWDELAIRLIKAGANPLQTNQNGEIPFAWVDQPLLVPEWQKATVDAEQRLLGALVDQQAARPNHHGEPSPALVITGRSRSRL